MGGGFPVGSVVKNLPVNSKDAGNVGIIPGLERSSGGENGNTLEYSCLKNPMKTMERQKKDMTLEDEPPRSVSVQYAAEEE